MLKKALKAPLPDGRGSVYYCKHGGTFPSRARQQAVFGFFQQPARELDFGEVYRMSGLFRLDVMHRGPGDTQLQFPSKKRAWR